MYNTCELMCDNTSVTDYLDYELSTEQQTLLRHHLLHCAAVGVGFELFSSCTFRVHVIYTSRFYSQYNLLESLYVSVIKICILTQITLIHGHDYAGHCV